MGLHMNPENPYLQYFIGLPGYQETPPFDASTLVLFRKRINARMLMEANEYLLEENKPDKKEDDNDDQTHLPIMEPAIQTNQRSRKTKAL